MCNIYSDGFRLHTRIEIDRLAVMCKSRNQS